MDLMETSSFPSRCRRSPSPRPRSSAQRPSFAERRHGLSPLCLRSREQAVHAIRTHHRLDPERQEHYEQALERGIFAENPPSMIHITGLEAELFASLLLLPRVLKKAGKGHRPAHRRDERTVGRQHPRLTPSRGRHLLRR